jgi:polyisoprenyl-phosphate glycosyltransferase
VTGLTSFSTAPLQLAASFTAFGILIGCGIAVYALAGRIFGHVVPGWTSLALFLAFFSTAQLACLAILSVYIGRIFVEVKRRPLFLEQEIVASEEPVGLAVSVEKRRAAG